MKVKDGKSLLCIYFIKSIYIIVHIFYKKHAYNCSTKFDEKSVQQNVRRQNVFGQSVFQH
jgi:hypothetical protein